MRKLSMQNWVSCEGDRTDNPPPAKILNRESSSDSDTSFQPKTFVILHWNQIYCFLLENPEMDFILIVSLKILVCHESLKFYCLVWCLTRRSGYLSIATLRLSNMNLSAMSNPCVFWTQTFRITRTGCLSLAEIQKFRPIRFTLAFLDWTMNIEAEVNSEISNNRLRCWHPWWPTVHCYTDHLR